MKGFAILPCSMTNIFCFSRSSDAKIRPPAAPRPKTKDPALWLTSRPKTQSPLRPQDPRPKTHVRGQTRTLTLFPRPGDFVARSVHAVYPPPGHCASPPGPRGSPPGSFGPHARALQSYKSRRNVKTPTLRFPGGLSSRSREKLGKSFQKR